MLSISSFWLDPGRGIDAHDLALRRSPGAIAGTRDQGLEVYQSPWTELPAGPDVRCGGFQP
jgi:hypothetical protein